MSHCTKAPRLRNEALGTFGAKLVSGRNGGWGGKPMNEVTLKSVLSVSS